MTQPIPVILAGFGQYVQNRSVLPFIKERSQKMEVVAVTSLLEGEYEKFVKPAFEQQGLPIPELINEFEQACSRKEKYRLLPQAVLITTPNACHFNQAKLALEAGYHVYVERPIVTPNDDLLELLQIAKQQNVVLVTGTQRRLEAPFQYLHSVATKNKDFGEIRRIRCHFAANHQLKNWRRLKEHAGGGIIIDSGYHLLDIVAWIVSSIGIEIPEQLDGAVHFGFDEMIVESNQFLEVETEAVGYVLLPNNILLSFDFTYNAPKNSIYESIELNDKNYASIKLTREEARRTSLPGVITHQKPDGTFAVIKGQRKYQNVRAETIRFADEAQNTKPLKLFIEAIKQSSKNAQDIAIMHARNSVATWHLIQAIYHLASGKESN